jgi:IS30 family transposase
MPRKKITPDHDKEMRRLGGLGKSVNQIARQLNLKYQTVHNYMKSHDIERGRELSAVRRLGPARKKQQPVAGFFNEHERENWLV